MTRREMLGLTVAGMCGPLRALVPPGEAQVAKPELIDTGWQPKLCGAAFGDEWERQLCCTVPPGFADMDWPRVDLRPPAGCVVIENHMCVDPDGLCGVQRLRAVRVEFNVPPS